VVDGAGHTSSGDNHPWPAEARRLAAEAREEHGADWATMPTWLLRSQWLRRLEPRVTVLLLTMSTVVTPQGEMVISERELANRLMWRFDVLVRVLDDAEAHRLIERVSLSALPTEMTWRLTWVWTQWQALHG